METSTRLHGHKVHIDPPYFKDPICPQGSRRDEKVTFLGHFGPPMTSLIRPSWDPEEIFLPNDMGDQYRPYDHVAW